MSPICETHKTQRCNELASILAIGTANPPNVVYQEDFADFYFRLTNSEHMIDMKAKFKRMCEKTAIKKRYMHLTEEIVKENPIFCDFNASSLDSRQAILAKEVPLLGKQAAMKAIKEWGKPKSDITHLIFCTTSDVDIPGADYHLTKLLGLNPSVMRYKLCQQGCHAGATVLRLAKDLAENTHNARVLAICSENMTVGFHGPSKNHLDNMLAQALFGDGAGAVIVGAHLNETSNERPLFQLVSTAQTILPDSEEAIEGHLRESGIVVQLQPNVAQLISNNIEKSLIEAFNPIGIHDWNNIFWISHPGGPAILNQIESKLGLNKSKLSNTWHVLSEFGNMSSGSVFFVLDAMRKRSAEKGKSTTGDGFNWGVLFGFGPGLTIETIVLRSFLLVN